MDELLQDYQFGAVDLAHLVQAWPAMGHLPGQLALVEGARGQGLEQILGRRDRRDADLDLARALAARAVEAAVRAALVRVGLLERSLDRKVRFARV